MPLTVDDQLAIQQLYARYNHAIDSGDAGGWAACFTSDGVFTSSNGGSFEGRESLVEFARGFAVRMKGRHWTNNLLLDATTDGASGTCYLMLYALGTKDEPARIVTTGIYVDALVRTPEGWRFSRRTVRGDA